MSKTKVWILWAVVFISFLLFIATAQANTVSLRHEVGKRLEAAGLLLGVGKDTGCEYLDLPAVVIVACHGADKRTQYAKVMKVLADLNPVDKYNSVFNSGHVEVR